ncbi:SPFH domain-containing protein [Streptomyces sp. HUAS MG47]|uniref:SPFH domain-containing protein n=1 Tax=Streptomyces solicamelliae TaxID=3231716 RepID=UPI003877F96A
MTTATPDRDREGEGLPPRTPPGAAEAVPDAPRPGAGRTPTGRRTPVIGAETTGPIPVHRLFREDPSAPPPPGGEVAPGPHTRPAPGLTPRPEGHRRADTVFDYEAPFTPVPLPARPHADEASEPGERREAAGPAPAPAMDQAPRDLAGLQGSDALRGASAPAGAAAPTDASAGGDDPVVPGSASVPEGEAVVRGEPELRGDAALRAASVPAGALAATDASAAGDHPVVPRNASVPEGEAAVRGGAPAPRGDAASTGASVAGDAPVMPGSASEPEGDAAPRGAAAPTDASAADVRPAVAGNTSVERDAAAPADDAAPSSTPASSDMPAPSTPASSDTPAPSSAPASPDAPAPHDAPASPDAESVTAADAAGPADEVSVSPTVLIPEPAAAAPAERAVSRGDSDASREAVIGAPAAPPDAAPKPRYRVFDFEALFAPGQAGVTVGTAAEASGGGGFQAADVRPAVVPPAARRAVDSRRAPRPKPAPKRPAPTADPALRERPGPVLPGWIGVAVGAAALAACAAVLWWAGAVPDVVAQMLRLPDRPYHGIHLGLWALLALGVLLILFSLGGLSRGRVGYAWVLTLFGEYRGTVRRTGLLWVSPLLLRRRVDVRLRHWRSEPLPAVDAKGTALDVVVLVVWRIRDTVRAALGVEHHEEYLREQVEAAMARVLSQLPADAFHEDAPTLRDAEAVGEALTKLLSAECAPVGIDVFSAQPTRIEYAPELAAAMQRRRIAAIDAKHRDSVLTSVVDAVDDMVHRLTTRGLVELDDYERKALVKDLTVAFYTGRGTGGEGA